MLGDDGLDLLFRPARTHHLGYGDASRLAPRGPRLSFDEVCHIL